MRRDGKEEGERGKERETYFKTETEKGRVSSKTELNSFPKEVVICK